MGRGLALLLIGGTLAAAPSWSTTGPLGTYEWGRSATRLADARILMVGGIDFLTGEMLTTCEIYDPATDTWSPTGGLIQPRAMHSAARLPDGRVLAVGGAVQATVPSIELLPMPLICETYDPSTGAWSLTEPLSRGRVFGTLTPLANGKVLLAGGNDYDYSEAPFSYPVLPLASCALYNPFTDRWESAPDLPVARTQCSATRLLDGKVLVVGGWNDTISLATPSLKACALYDPASNTWSAGADTIKFRTDHTATRLADGRVLVAGTSADDMISCEIYDPAAGTWIVTGSLIGDRKLHSAVRLPSGKILVCGGEGTNYDLPDAWGTIKTCELYDPATGLWSPAPSMPIERQEHAAMLIDGGKVLVANGYSWAPDLTTGVYEHTKGVIYDSQETAGAPGAVVDVAVGSLNAPASAGVGETVRVTAIVANDGTDAAAFAVDFAIDGSVVAGVPLTVAAGDLAGVSTDWATAGASPGTHTITATVTPLSGEIDVADNSASVGVSLTGGPDGSDRKKSCSASVPYDASPMLAIAALTLALCAGRRLLSGP